MQDKNQDDPNAKEKFQNLQEAYEAWCFRAAQSWEGIIVLRSRRLQMAHELAGLS